MTEDEALTKWCPLVRFTQETSYSYPFNNREEKIGVSPKPLLSRCIASECMAWRFGQKRNPKWAPRNSMIAHFEQHPDDIEPAYISDDASGYCGLAGRQ